MQSPTLVLRIAVLVFATLLLTTCGEANEGGSSATTEVMTEYEARPRGIAPLPEPRVQGEMSLEETLAARQSERDYTTETLGRGQISQLLWAAQGVTRDGRGRTTPSAGALYPLELYLVTGEGVFRYRPDHHDLEIVAEDDVRDSLYGAALRQEAVRDAPAVFVVTAVFDRTAAKYGDRAVRYVYLEAGHAAHGVLLQAVSLGLGAVPIGAFDDTGVQRILGLPDDHEPLYLIPVGHLPDGLPD